MYRIRIVLLPFALIWLLFAFWTARTLYVGGELYWTGGHMLGYVKALAWYSSLFVAFPPVLLLWLGVKKRTYAIGVALSIIVPLLVVEAVAQLEKRLFVLECKNPQSLQWAERGRYLKFRWLKNGQRLLFYDPVTSELSCH